MSQIITPEPVTETIDELEFRVIPFDAYFALGLMARLIKSVGPALGALSGLDPESDLSSLNVGHLREAFTSLEPGDAQKLALELLRNTSVLIDDGGKVKPRVNLHSEEKFNRVFNGRLKTLFKVLALSLKVNFASFSAGS